MTTRRFAEVVALLMKRPRTPLELCVAIELKGRQTQAYRYLAALKDEGVIYVKEWHFASAEARNPSPVYAWQPSVCAFEDAPKPSAVRVCAEAAA